MCNFLSLCVNKTGRVIGDGHEDSHTKIYEQNEIKDDKPAFLQNWCKIEVLPKDHDIFNHDLDNWDVKIDDERTPDWYGPKHEKACIDRLERILKKVFIIGGEHDCPLPEIRFIKDAKVNIIKTTIDKVWGGTVNEVRGGGTVNRVFGGTVNEVRGGTVNEVLGGGTVNKVRSGTVNEVRSGTVDKVLGGTVNKVLGGTVNKVFGGTVNKVFGGTVNKVLGGTVNKVMGGTVNELKGNATITLYENIKIKNISGGGNVIIKRYLKNVKVDIK